MSNREMHDKMLNASRKALQNAGRAAIERGRRTGTPVYIWEGGKAVDLIADAADDASPTEGELLARVREELE